MTKGILFDLQRNSLVDGPGIRTTVFLKGCNLRCVWCHNPESQTAEPQLLFYEDRCTHCGVCAEVCPHHLTDCTLCGECASLCTGEARSLRGQWHTTDEIWAQIAKDMDFYRLSGGGVTFSGGECMLQLDFLREMLRICKQNGVHTAVDTAGHVPWQSFDAVLPDTDLFLYDLKCVTPELHRKGTGVSNELILENLQRLAKQSDVILRIPIVPEFNDTPDELEKMAAFVRTLHCRSVEVLPYHTMGEAKYRALGRKAPSFVPPAHEDMQRYAQMFDAQIG